MKCEACGRDCQCPTSAQAGEAWAEMVAVYEAAKPHRHAGDGTLNAVIMKVEHRYRACKTCHGRGSLPYNVGQQLCPDCGGQGVAAVERRGGGR